MYTPAARQKNETEGHRIGRYVFSWKLIRKISKYLLTGRSFCCIKYLEIFLNTREGGRKIGFAETFKALSDPARREILGMLKNGRLSAGEIASHFNMTNATISYHLNILKKAELVFEHREKNYIFYELNVSVLEELMVWIADLKGDKNVKEE